MLTAEEIATGRSSLLGFSQINFRHERRAELTYNWHQTLICDALEKVLLGLTKRLIINVPPRSGKTELAVKQFMAWAGGIYPDSEFIHASYSKKLAASNTYATRALMQSETYRQIFPWCRIAGDSAARDEFRTAAGGVYYASGSEGTITGYGAGKMRPGFGGAILIDDPHKPGEALSDVQRPKVIDWFQMTMESRLNTPDTPIVVIMQRLHEEDLAGWLLGGGNNEEWELLKIPAINPDGSSFWEKQFPVERLRHLEKSSGFVYSGQYLQEPIPRGGVRMNRDWFKVVPVAPVCTRWVRGWDLAGSVTSGAAYSAGAKMGITADGKYVIADMRRERLEGSGVERLLVNTASQDGMGVHGSIPQDPGSAGKSWAQYLIGKLAPYSYTSSVETGEKEIRAEGFASQAEAGNVMLVAGPWNNDFLAEAETFPAGKFKDQIDACSRAFMELTLDEPFQWYVGGL